MAPEPRIGSLARDDSGTVCKGRIGGRASIHPTAPFASGEWWTMAPTYDKDLVRSSSRDVPRPAERAFDGTTWAGTNKRHQPAVEGTEGSSACLTLLTKWMSNLINTLVTVMLIASALIAYAVRRNAVMCLAALAFLPLLPAAVRYVLADPTIASAESDTSVRFVLLGAINFGAVWGGFLAGVLYGWLAGPRAPAKGPVIEPSAIHDDAAIEFGNSLPREHTTHDAA